VTFLNSMGWGPAALFFPKYLQEAHRWTPAQVSSLVVFGGAVGILGAIVSGRLSDGLGRRTLGSLCMFMGPLFAIWMYQTRTNAVIWLWILRLFLDQATTTILAAYSVELFPTSHRSAAGSALAVAGTTGGALGLFLEGVLYGVVGSHWDAIRILMVFSMAAAMIMFAAFPETSRRELEEISPEAAGAATPAAIR
jgi:MFS family permease